MMPSVGTLAKRRRASSLVSRLGTGGVPEALSATAIFAFSEATYDPGKLSGLQLGTDVALALFAGLSGRWPRLGGSGAGIALGVFGFVHFSTPISFPLTFTCALIPVVSTGARGFVRLRDLLALWYFTTLVLMTTAAAATPTEGIQSSLLMGGLMLLAWASGRTVYRLRTEREQQAELGMESLRAQRRGIARDLHDTVAYSTTTMIMRAEEIKLRTTDEQLIADLNFIIVTGRRSVRDLRGMLETLRRSDPSFHLDTSDGSPWTVTTIGDVLDARVRELAAHGLTATVSVGADLDNLPRSIHQTLAKVIVEATSNMVKHSARGACAILIESDDGILEAVFTNPVRPGSPPSSRGFGLLGASERVEAIGGELEATTASGTWILRVQLPVGGE